MDKLFDPGQENRLFNLEGMKIESKNDGDNFRLEIINSIIEVVNKNNINIQSIIDVGSGLQGGFGKGIKEILKVSETKLYQMDLKADEQAGIHKGNILLERDLPNSKFNLGLLIQVLRDIEGQENVQLAIKNLMNKTNYSVITSIDPAIREVEGETYFDFKWVDQNKKQATISTRFFDGTAHVYKPFYVQEKQEIENVIKQNCVKILKSGSWLYNQPPIYNYWITKNK